MPAALIRIADAAGRSHLQQVEVARSEVALQRGLVGRRAVPLLLILPRPEPRALTTVGVLEALDVAWIRGDGGVCVVGAMTPGLARVDAPCVWAMVLEMPRGLGRAWGVEVGTTVSIVAE